jgi:hypothetical protein
MKGKRKRRVRPAHKVNPKLKQRRTPKPKRRRGRAAKPSRELGAKRRYVNRLIPVGNWAHEHAWPSEGGLRHLIFHGAKNGFSRAIVRVGRRVLIDERAFFNWARSRQQLEAKS